MKKIFFGAAAVMVLYFLNACADSAGKTHTSEREVIPVRTMPLKKEPVQRFVSASGQFTTDDEAYLSFKTGGIISRIYVKEGDAVSKGQLLASLDLSEIEAMTRQAKLGYDKATRDYQRVSNLYKDSVTSQEQLQNSKTALDIAADQLSIAEFNLKYSEIRALSDGFVLKKLASEGQLIEAGMPVLQTNGAGKSDWLLKTGVSDVEWASIGINDKAEVEIDAYPGETFPAYVFRKSEGADPYTGTLSVDLKLSVSKALKITSGLFGKASISLNRKIDSWRIPYDALLDADGNSGYVFITQDNLTAKKIKVSIADVTNNHVLVSAGLENAHTLIVSGSAYLTDNSKIKIMN